MTTITIERELLEAEIEQLRADYRSACELVARMHAAAVGVVSGPILGVVEDVAALRAENERLRAAPATAPAWQDAPTKPGVWFCDEGDICYTWTAHNIEILDQFDPGDGLRWFGPIPEDKR